MERITIFIRTTKTEGTIRLRFRLRDTNGVQLYYKSAIKANLKDLAKFNIDGSLKGRVSVFNTKLKSDIERVMDAMRAAYNNLSAKMEKTHISGEMFEKEVAKILDAPETIMAPPKESMLDRFGRFIEQAYKDDVFNEKRMKSDLCVKDCIERFLIDKTSEEDFG